LQAAVAAFEIAPVGSNIVRMVVRSNPVFENQLTNVAIEARHGDAYPGAEATVTVRVHNAGESSAHDVVAVVPVPSFTSYIPNSARVNGREIEADLKVPFDRAYAPVIARTLPASATLTLTYRIRIEDPLDDATAIVSRATIASQEPPSFALSEATLTVQAAARFDDGQTSVTIEPAAEVAPGQRVTLRLRATNAGTMAAHHVTAAVTLADGLLLVRGASRLDGHPLREKKKETGVFEIGRIDARATAELSLDAMVASPLPNGTQLDLSLQLQWESGERAFVRTLAVRSQPFLTPRRLIFLIGAALYASGLALPGKVLAPQVPWPQRIDDAAAELPREAKIEMIERLGLIGVRWCEEILQQADTEENDLARNRVRSCRLPAGRDALI